jgi:catechol 2,3-dioxygenase-like lactoylglutathione lyase family enzyme
MKYAALFISLVLLSACQNQGPRFNHVMLYVSDLDRSIEFYTSAFDLEVERVDQMRRTTPEGDEELVEVNMAFLRFPGRDFVLEIAQNTAGDSDRLSHSFQHIGVDVRDIEQADRRVLAAGAESYSPVRTAQANGTVVRLAFYTGPDGEIIELIQVLEGEF